MTESDMIENAYRAIEGYFGAEPDYALTLQPHKAYVKVIRWLKEEHEDRKPDAWEFNIAFKRFVRFVNEH